jgi:hypothetical protein
MAGDHLPDYGLALLKAKAQQPVELNPLFVEDVGRVDEDTLTMIGKIQHNDEWHMASVDFPVGMLDQFLAALPPAKRDPIGKLLRRDGTEPFNEHLSTTLSLAVAARLGQLQQNESEQYVPFVGLSVTAGLDVTFIDDVVAEALGPLKIDMGQEILAFQVKPDLGKDEPRLGTIGMVAAVFFACLAGPFMAKPRAHGWTCFIAMQPHITGLNLWIGVTAKIPVDLLNNMAAGLESLGTQVNREMSIARQHQMLPIAHIDRDGTFFLHAPGMQSPPEQLIQNISAATETDVVVREIVTN